jgi:hypothetical protein
MQLQTPIQPIETSKPAVEAVCKLVVFTFGEGGDYANSRIELFDEDGLIVAQHQVSFTKAELDGWGEDDEFVLDLALTKLGIAH